MKWKEISLLLWDSLANKQKYSGNIEFATYFGNDRTFNNVSIFFLNIKPMQFCKLNEGTIILFLWASSRFFVTGLMILGKVFGQAGTIIVISFLDSDSNFSNQEMKSNSYVLLVIRCYLITHNLIIFTYYTKQLK